MYSSEKLQNSTTKEPVKPSGTDLKKHTILLTILFVFSMTTATDGGNISRHSRLKFEQQVSQNTTALETDSQHYEELNNFEKEGIQNREKHKDKIIQAAYKLYNQNVSFSTCWNGPQGIYHEAGLVPKVLTKQDELHRTYAPDPTIKEYNNGKKKYIYEQIPYEKNKKLIGPGSRLMIHNGNIFDKPPGKDPKVWLSSGNHSLIVLEGPNEAGEVTIIDTGGTYLGNSGKLRIKKKNIQTLKIIRILHPRR